MKTFKNVLVLTIITVLAGFLLGYVYDITKEPIKNAKENDKQEACKKVFSEATSFEEDESIHVSNSDAILEDAGFSSEQIDDALLAKDAAGNVLGAVLNITTKKGYGGEIKISLGVKADGTISGIEILEISETAGLGMKANTDEFKNQFANKKVSSVTFTKTGAKEDYEIDAISGATITTTAMVDAVNAGLFYYNAVKGE